MFSQHNEEEIILANTPPFGRFADIGAFDGKTFSNTHALALKGWHGICVEPSPIPFCALMALYRNNPRIYPVNAVVSKNDYGLVKFQSTPDALGTTEKKNYEKWKSVGQFQEIMAAQVPIREILKDHIFDFLSIDTEGTSLDILDAIIPSANGINLICVEYDDQQARAEQWFSNRNFRILYDDGTNMIGKRNA